MRLFINYLSQTVCTLFFISTFHRLHFKEVQPCTTAITLGGWKIMISTVLYTVLIAWGLYMLFFYKSRRERLLKNVKYPPQLPIIGLALNFGSISNERLFMVLNYGVEMYKGFTCGWMFNLPYVIASRVDVVQKILTSTNMNKSPDYNLVKPWLGTGLLTSEGKKWFVRRKMLTPAFHFSILEDFMGVFNEQSKVLVEILKAEHGDGKPFNIFPYVTRCALDIICESAMGKQINAQSKRDSDYVKAIYRIVDIIMFRMLRPWFHPAFIWKFTKYGREERRLLKILHGFTRKVITERKLLLQQQRQEPQKQDKSESDDVYMNAKRRRAFLDLLITTQMDETDPTLTLSDSDIMEETDTFMFEGHDTTAASTNWTIYLLGCHPEYQTKVHEELEEIFGDDKDRPVTSEDLTKMKYLECCIKESLRLYPSVPFFARSVHTDIAIDDETAIPAGATAFVMAYSLHRDRDIYPIPEAFFPDRFLPEHTAKRHPFAYIPFSAGPRNCIGQKFALMEEKVLLANLFRHFRVRAAERRENIILLAELILRPKHGLQIKLVPK